MELIYVLHTRNNKTESSVPFFKSSQNMLQFFDEIINEYFLHLEKKTSIIIKKHFKISYGCTRHSPLHRTCSVPCTLQSNVGIRSASTKRNTANTLTCDFKFLELIYWRKQVVI